MLKINHNTIFYIACPANFATGGPEDLHQLADELRNMGHKAYMYYYNYKKSKGHPVHKEYVHFNIPYVTKVENDENNVLILPETSTVMLWKKKYSKMQHVVWWLSVTNFFIVLNKIKEKKMFFWKKIFKKNQIPTVDNLNKINAFHLAHSYFSLDFLRNNKMNILGQIQDYMDDMFYTNEDLFAQKEKIVTYNGVKNGEFLEKIKAKTPDVNWLPMQNMTLKEVADCMKRAMVYIDFGYHPGKEKMPREACLLDCCMIVGKDGSAKYKEDMPILDEYHFEKDEKYIPEIINKIYDCLENYETKIKDFKTYKEFLLKEKETFKADVKQVFSINESL